MSTEIEIKAWVRRPEETLALVEKLCVFERDYVKADAYYLSPDGEALRVRSENGKWVCTWKEKTVQNGLEVNNENEFEVSDGRLFTQLLEKLGCVFDMRKVKRGKSYSCRGLTVEVSELEGLGLFIEAEKVLENPSREETALWEKTLRAFLAEV